MLGEEERGQQLMTRCVGTGGKTFSLQARVAAGVENA